MIQLPPPCHSQISLAAEWRQQLRELKMDGITVLIMSMMFFICFIAWGFVIAFSYGNMKGDDEQKEDGVKKEPEDGSDADEVLEATKVIVEVNNYIAEAIGDIDGDETVDVGVQVEVEATMPMVVGKVEEESKF
ncbi:hypothetical protein GOBAR_AA38253 [Gossypium barbadense]|uniref:Uncharacterized protein n=1 Tax=Gossypium barbadense TaxID=3634 RepID=A0A2P5VUE9_GOSBA|nr:hypothetical protein GOBAR_AA38253 [Gossypium barbadense]